MYVKTVYVKHVLELILEPGRKHIDHWEDFHDIYATKSDFESHKLKSRRRLTVVDIRLTADRYRNYQL